MEQVIELNEQVFFANNRDQAQKRNAVELKQTLRFPQELLSLFSAAGKPSTLDRATCLHMFETSPQSKCAVAYKIKKADGVSEVNIIIVYSVVTNTVLRILRSESEVTQICTPGEDSILIVGTILGSINLYDMKEFEGSNRGITELDYDSLLRVLGYDPS